MRLTRRERVKLLLCTYVDAVSPGRKQSDIRGALGSRPPARSQLQDEGSYFELGQALDKMRQPCPKLYKHTVAFYVDPEPWARKSTAEKGLSVLVELMPRNIFVPQDISERYGFIPSEAKSAAMPWMTAA